MVDARMPAWQVAAALKYLRLLMDREAKGEDNRNRQDRVMDQLDAHFAALSADSREQP